MAVIAEKIMQEQLAPTLDRLAPDARWHLSGPVGRARKCDIFKITNDMHTHTLALKVYRPNIAKVRGAKTQFAALKTLRENNQACDVSAPHAHAFLPDANAIVMDWIDAPSLQSMLWRRALSPRAQLTLVTKVAQWLRRFHEHGGITYEPFKPAIIQNHLTRRMAASPLPTSKMRDGKTFITAHDYLQKHAVHVQIPLPHAILHGDFTPSNVLVKDNEVVGIDIWSARRAPVYEDIARMLTYLSINSPFALRRTPLLHNGQSTELFIAFAEGYGPDLMKHDMFAIWYIILYQHLRRWLVFVNWKQQGRSAITAKLEAERVCSLIQQILAHIHSFM